MKNLKFRVGEWCFCEFELKQVTQTEENRITGVTCGLFITGSYDLTDRCYPLDLEIKRISDSVEYWSKKFHALEINGLNHPDLNRELIHRWVEMCEAKDNKDQLRALYKSLDEFGNSFIKRIENLKMESVEGVALFRL